MKYSNFTAEDKETLLTIFVNNPKTLDVVRRSIFQHNDMKQNYSRLSLVDQNVTHRSNESSVGNVSIQEPTQFSIDSQTAYQTIDITHRPKLLIDQNSSLAQDSIFEQYLSKNTSKDNIKRSEVNHTSLIAARNDLQIGVKKAPALESSLFQTPNLSIQQASTQLQSSQSAHQIPRVAETQRNKPKP